MTTQSFPHEVTRLAFDTGQPYEEFRARYEGAVPALDMQRLAALIARAAPWDEIVADATESAPLGFLIYSRSDATPLMSLAGDTAQCTRGRRRHYALRRRPAQHAFLELRQSGRCPGRPIRHGTRGFDRIVRMKLTTAALNGARESCTVSRFAECSALLSPRDRRFAAHDSGTMPRRHDTPRSTHTSGEATREGKRS